MLFLLRPQFHPQGILVHREELGMGHIFVVFMLYVPPQVTFPQMVDELLKGFARLH